MLHVKSVIQKERDNLCAPYMYVCKYTKMQKGGLETDILLACEDKICSEIKLKSDVLFTCLFLSKNMQRQTNHRMGKRENNIQSEQAVNHSL